MRLIKLIAIFGFALLTTLTLPAQTVRVIFTSGAASIQRPDEAGPRPIVKGESVIIGSRIVTGADGRVVLTPMPGVKSIIAPNTTLSLESSSETKTSDTNVTHQAVIDLKEGAVVSDLQKPEGVTYDYSIRTARGLAGARGTTFTVGINAAGIQTIVVAHGTISLSFTDGRQVSIALGHLSITPPGGETKTVGSVSELTTSEKAIAQNWTETTIGAIAAAIEAGVEVDPKALQNALAAAESLGITLSPELQALVDRVLALLAIPTTSTGDTDTKTIQDAVTEAKPMLTGFASIEAYIASLTEDQAAAFASLRNGPDSIHINFVETETPPETTSTAGYSDAQLAALLRDGNMAAGLTNLLNLYGEFKQEFEFSDNDITYFLTNLGILGDNNFTAIGSDTAGLKVLMLAYLESSPLIQSESSFVKGNNSTVHDNIDIFFPGEGLNNEGKGVTIYDVTFENDGDYLRIGATRNLLLDGVTLNTGYAESEYGGRVELRASDLVSLNNTSFGPYVTSILIEAATINLANVTFRDGSHVDLNSKFGEANFGSSKFGYVNFIKNVNYGETNINATTLPGLTNIKIGVLGDGLNR
jgi:hypothetical protein